MHVTVRVAGAAGAMRHRERLQAFGAHHPLRPAPADAGDGMLPQPRANLPHRVALSIVRRSRHLGMERRNDRGRLRHVDDHLGEQRASITSLACLRWRAHRDFADRIRPIHPRRVLCRTQVPLIDELSVRVHDGEVRDTGAAFEVAIVRQRTIGLQVASRGAAGPAKQGHPALHRYLPDWCSRQGGALYGPRSMRAFIVAVLG